MDKIQAFLKNNPDRAIVYAQAWEELLAAYPQLISLNTQAEWDTFRREHPGLSLDSNLWPYGPLSLEDEIQNNITQHLSEGEEEKASDQNKQQKEVEKGIVLHRISGILTQKKTESEQIAITNASITVTDIRTKKKLETIRTDSRGRFQTRLLRPDRYLLVLRHPDLNGKEIKRVINLRAFQPPLKIIFKGPPPQPDTEDIAAAPPPSSAETPILTVDTPASGNQRGATPSNVSPSDEGDVIPITERVGYSYENNPEQDTQPIHAKKDGEKTTEKLVPFFFITQGQNGSTPVSEQAMQELTSLDLPTDIGITDLFTILENDSQFQELKAQQQNRWKQDSGQDLLSKEGQNYTLGNPQNPTAPTLNKDTLALFRAEYPSLFQQYTQALQKKIYTDEQGNPLPTKDPYYQHLVSVVDKASRRALTRGNSQSSPVDFRRLSLEASLPYYRTFIKQFPEKARAYAQHDNALFSVLAYLETVNKTTSPITNTSALSNNLPPSTVGNNLPDITPVHTPPSSAGFYEDGSPVEAANTTENKNINMSESTDNQQDTTLPQIKRRAPSQPEQREHSQPPRTRNRPPTRNPRRIGAGNMSRGVRGAAQNTARLARLAAFFAPGTPGFWVLVIGGIILLLLLILLIIFSANKDKGDVSVTVTKTGPEKVDNGAEIAYTINVSYRNASQVTVKDKLPEGTEFVSASGTHTYDPITHTVTWTVAAGGGGSVSGDIAALLPNPVPPDTAAGANKQQEVLAHFQANPELIQHYKDASTKSGIPWQVYAGIHWRESDATPGRSLTSGRPIGSHEPDVTVCNGPSGVVDGLAEPGCVFTDEVDDILYVTEHLKGKIGGENPSTHEKLSEALARYNGFPGRANCTPKSPLYNHCPELFPGEDNSYVFTFFDEKHAVMDEVFCGDGQRCGPLEATRPGAMAVIKWVAASIQ